MAQILAVLGYALFCKIMDEAGVKHNIGPVSANLLTIPINSNELPSGVIGDACNYERKTHNEAKAQKEMRENEARQRREDERIERENNEVRALTAQRELARKTEKKERYLRYQKDIKDGKGEAFEKECVELYELEILYDSDKIGILDYWEQEKNILDKYRNEKAEYFVRIGMTTGIKEFELFTKSRQLLEKGNYLQFKKNIKDGKGRKYEEQFVELYELEILYKTDKIGFDYHEQKKNIYAKYKNVNETFGQYIKIEAPHTPPASLKITTTPSLPKTKESIDKYVNISTEAYSQYNAGKITASEYLKVQNNVSEVYEKTRHLISTSVQFSNQVYLKISEDASKQYKAGKMTAGEFAKVHNDARTKYYTEPVKPSTQVHRQPNSTLNNIGNGYVASAQARVNAVNLATTAVSTTARAVANVATAVGNAYIQGSNDMANTRRMEAQATQQLVSNVATAVGNGATAVGNGFVNPSANSEQTNQVLNMVSNAPSAVDLCLSNPRGIGINIATGMLAEVNNSYNERSTTRNMVNGTIGAVGLVAGVVGAPTIATAIGGTALAVEGAELVNNMHNTIIERAPTEVRANMLSDSW
jgi:hypothetical protein